VAKYIVQVFGHLPDSLIVEAESQDEAEQMAADQVWDELNFTAELEEEELDEEEA
jgi:hypothetical protein